MAFQVEANDHLLTIDADETVGGSNKGPRPKPLLLVALAGCTAMDTISILKKMRIKPDKFNVKVEGKLTESYPKHYSQITVIYEFKGEELNEEKVKKAVLLSEEKYCGVSHILKQVVKLTHKIIINNEIVE